ncbi:hypothetical protein [Minwuia sp.]|uniref:hypothetical protein n=1 Tax=Minwuia sp. TaxID=2493630 RepID=UPI003A938F42
MPRSFLVMMATALALVLSAGIGASAAETVDVRFGDHKGFSRAVFDWPDQVGFRLEEKPDGILIHFDRPAEFDLSNFKARGPRAISAVRVLDQGRTVQLSAPSGSVLKKFRIGSRIVIDVAVDPRAKSGSASSPKPAGKPQKTIAPAAPQPVRAKAKATAPVAKAKKPVAHKSPEPAARTVAGDGNFIPVTYELRPGRTILRFDWPEPTAAAVLHRGEHIWLAFGGDAELSFGDQPAEALGPVERVVREFASSGTLVRIDVATGVPLDVTLDGDDWIIDVGGARGRAETAIDFESQADAQGGPRIFGAIAAHSEPVIVDDPQIGDRIVLVPLMDAGVGVRPAREFVKLDLPETPQGVAIRFKSLDLRVTADDTGLSISGPKTLHLTAEADDAVASDDALPALSGTSLAATGRTLLDLKEWQGEGDMTTNRQRHLQRIALAKPAARNAERKAYARFLVAHGLGAEALGVMARIEEEDRRADLDPGFRAIRGISRLMTGQLGDANADLKHPSVLDAGDVALFRGLLAFKRREFGEARRELRAGWQALDQLPVEMHPMFRIAMANTALELNDPKAAQEQVSKLVQFGGADQRKEDAALIAARIHDLIGDVEEAEVAFGSLSRSTHRDVRARATFAETNLLLREDRITAEEAIERLERLRFAWRGDVFEFDLLKRLGELYIETGAYRDGMVTMRRTVDDFPDLPEAQRLAADMNDVFARLFEGTYAEKMSPVTAMGLYYDFRELTPEGDRGDRMIRRLADRLAAVELLDEAAKLLEHQVSHRLKGIERSRVATRLSVLYLLDGKPREAINALRRSRDLSIPEELVRERRLLEARGLTELGNYDRALMLLNGLEGADVGDVRTEILWRARKWQRAAASLSARLVDIRGSSRPLAKEQRRDILRFAIASSLADDRAALGNLREDFAERMEGQPEWPAFKIVTAEDQRDTAEFRNLAAEIAQVDRFEAFMASYRERLREKPLSAIN